MVTPTRSPAPEMVGFVKVPGPEPSATPMYGPRADRRKPSFQLWILFESSCSGGWKLLLDPWSVSMLAPAT